ncbi:MAG TPA: DUF4185 domain-containing protein [Polyangiales bacterium]|nr:DUF4185 domain-containing protein [Polyangiales bacterium]
MTAERGELTLGRAVLGISCAWCLCAAAGCAFGPLPDVDERGPVAQPRPWIEHVDSTPRSSVPVPQARADDANRPVSASREPSLRAPETLPRLRKLQTQHLGQWTAREPNRIDALGFSGTDLGVSFSHQGELWFLFGDSQSVFDYCGDSLARTPLAPLSLDPLPKLDWTKRPSGLFESLRVPGVELGFMNVAVEGLSLGERAYVFFATGWSERLGRHTGSALAHTSALGAEPLVLDHAVDSEKFINVSALRQGEYVYIWGSGTFRKSDVYLARVRSDALADRSAWQYFRGASSAEQFGPGEDSAQPIVSAGCVGELSVRKHPQLGLYLLAYNCERPRGVFLRTATEPAGPYSVPIQLFDPWFDRGYEHFIHASPTLTGRDDGLSDPGREEQSGGEYGAYLVPEWFSEVAPGVYGIVYTLSSWNPYQVHVMRTLLGESLGAWLPPATALPNLAPEGTAMLSAGDPSFAELAAWTHAGDGGSMSAASDGVLVMSSAVAPLGAAATGTLWRDFSVDDSVSTLEFEVQGGDAEVLLMADDEVVRRVRGRGDSLWRPVAFQLDGLRGKRLRLALYDRATDAWGFVAVRNPRLR